MRATLTRRARGSMISRMPDPIYKYLGAAIQQRRRHLGLRQRVLAAHLAISRGSLANIEIGRQGVLVHQLYRIAAALHLPPTELLPPIPTTPRVNAPSLPLPPDLKPMQRDQILRLMEGHGSELPPRKERKHAKRTT